MKLNCLVEKGTKDSPTFLCMTLLFASLILSVGGLFWWLDGPDVHLKPENRKSFLLMLALVAMSGPISHVAGAPYFFYRDWYDSRQEKRATLS